MISLLSSALFAALVAAQVAVPPLKARVTDLTGTLNGQQRSALEQTLAEFEARKGSQIAVLLVPTTKPEPAFDYGVRVFDAWKLGRKGADDGVLLLVAKDDRQLRIITGRGVEGVLPDAIAKRIIEEEITPRFRRGDFYGGVRAGTDRMMRLIEGETLPPAPQRQAPGQRNGPGMESIVALAIVAIALSGVLRMVFGRALGAGVTGGVAGVVAWFLLSSLALAIGAGLIVFFVSLVSGTGRRGGWSSGGWSSGGWSSGGWGGGGFGGGGFGGGGGFSGGGGSTAGGGAGGSW